MFDLPATATDSSLSTQAHYVPLKHKGEILAIANFMCETFAICANSKGPGQRLDDASGGSHCGLRPEGDCAAYVCLRSSQSQCQIQSRRRGGRGQMAGDNAVVACGGLIILVFGHSFASAPAFCPAANRRLADAKRDDSAAARPAKASQSHPRNRKRQFPLQEQLSS